MPEERIIRGTLQELFDRACGGLIKQGRKSGEDRGGSIGFVCRYRAPNGDKCAAGWLIPDEAYSPDMEGYVISGPTLSSFVSFEAPRGADMAHELQRAHDSAPAGPKWRSYFVETARMVAARYGLSPAILDGEPS